METVYVALIAGVATVITGFIAPMIMAHQLNKSRRAEKVQDWARQDEVAESLLKRQDELRAKAEETAALLVASDKRVADAAEATQAQLRIIHTLVNSNMTAAMQAEFDALVALLAALLEVVDLKKAAGIEPNATALETIEATRGKITELRASLADRVRAADNLAAANSA